MARPTDETKLEAIKKAAIQLVVEQGISGASIAQIARKAKVSDGYLYRFYKGKRELLEDLFLERSRGIYDLLEQQLRVHNTVLGIIRAFVVKVFASAAQEPEAICFYHKLLNDFSFEIPEKIKEANSALCWAILDLGHASGEIRAGISPEHFFSVVTGGTLQFVMIRLRMVFQPKPLDQEDAEHQIEIILKALQ